MNNYGFVRVAAAIPHLKVANCKFNAERIETIIKTAVEKQVQIICFPELSITAYTCGDLFHQDLLVNEAERYLLELVENTAQLDILSIVGLPVRDRNSLYNAAVAFQHGKILAVVPKTYLPNYNEFYEQRWFDSADNLQSSTIKIGNEDVPLGSNILLKSGKTCVAIEVCEDLWVPISPSSSHALAGANIIFNLSATNELIAKNDYLHALISQQSARCLTGYIYSSCGFGESSTDVVFAGNGYIAENGSFIAESKRFSFEEQLTISEIDVERMMNERREITSFSYNANNTVKLSAYQTIEFKLANYHIAKLSRFIGQHPFVPAEAQMDRRCNEIFNIQISGLATRLKHTEIKTITIGISGGLDSTLALLVCVKTFDKLCIPRNQIIGVTMPGFGTTDQTYNNAINMMTQLGVSIREIDIKDACIQHFKDIEHPAETFNVTYENSQARERTQILMDISNQTNGLVIGTGDLSELALGWATYNGDHMSMYGINVSIPKTLVRHLVHWVALAETDAATRKTLLDVLQTPVSPELLPADENGNIAQKTEDLVGPYELHDFFLYYTIRFGFSPAKIYFLAKQAFEEKYDAETIKKWMYIFFKRFFSHQFKRSCMPDGPKVGSICLSPRGDWRMPSDASSQMWLEEIERL
jgi:NAD+ synthase (glutamine-hydrolysing)